MKPRTVCNHVIAAPVARPAAVLHRRPRCPGLVCHADAAPLPTEQAHNTLLRQRHQRASFKPSPDRPHVRSVKKIDDAPRQHHHKLVAAFHFEFVIAISNFLDCFTFSLSILLNLLLFPEFMSISRSPVLHTDFLRPYHNLKHGGSADSDDDGRSEANLSPEYFNPFASHSGYHLAVSSVSSIVSFSQTATHVTRRQFP